MPESPVSELWEVFRGLFDPIVGDVIGSQFGAQAQMIADILLKETVSIVSANHRVRKMDIFDHGLKLSLVVLGDLATEDDGNLVGLTDHSVGIQESVAQLIECGPAVKNEVVAKLHLGEEEPVLAAATFAFALFEERSQTGRLFLPAAEQVVGAQAICQLLELAWMTAFEKCIGHCLKSMPSARIRLASQ
jgi:hypothetical protein